MSTDISRRAMLLAIPALALLPVPAHAAAAVFYRNAGCGCCHLWAERMNAAGLPVTLADSDDLTAENEKLGVPEDLQSCHVGVIGGYVVSGHVPAEDIKRLLAERPEGVGLAVPGMPAGSPGMDGGASEPYATLLFHKDGSSSIYATHG